MYWVIVGFGRTGGSTEGVSIFGRAGCLVLSFSEDISGVCAFFIEVWKIRVSSVFYSS